MSKPRRSLINLFGLRSTLNKYTGRTFIRRLRGPITHVAPSPASVLRRAIIF